MNAAAVIQCYCCCYCCCCCEDNDDVLLTTAAAALFFISLGCVAMTMSDLDRFALGLCAHRVECTVLATVVAGYNKIDKE
jgi:hypothetical protein